MDAASTQRAPWPGCCGPRVEKPLGVLGGPYMRWLAGSCNLHHVHMAAWWPQGMSDLTLYERPPQVMYCRPISNEALQAL